MVVTRFGDRTASVQSLVGVGGRPEREHVPVHHRQMAEKTAADWDPILLAENATIRSVQVRSNFCHLSGNYIIYFLFACF